jgi:hypothetical protein
VASAISCPSTAYPPLLGRTIAARDHRAHQGGQVRDAVGIEFRGIADPAAVAEQLPDGNRVVGEADRSQVIVGGGVETEAAFGDKPQHRGGRHQRGDAGRGEPAASVQDLGSVQVGVPLGDHPRRTAGLTAGQDQSGQAELGEGVVGDRGYFGQLGGLGCRGCRGCLGAGRRRGAYPRIGDPFGQRKTPQAGQAVRRVGIDNGQVPHPGQLNVGFQRRQADHDELCAQVCGGLAELGHQIARRYRGQETVIEMLAELVIGGGRPAGAVGAGEAGDHPAQLG